MNKANVFSESFIETFKKIRKRDRRAIAEFLRIYRITTRKEIR